MTNNSRSLKFCLLLILFVSLSQFSLNAKDHYSELPFVTLNQRQLCDLELLLNEGFAPLKGFMGPEDYDSVVNDMRLADGTLWPIPIVLDINDQDFNHIGFAHEIALRDPENFTLAVLEISAIWKPNKQEEAQKVYGTTNKEHPGVNYLLSQTGKYYVGGSLKPVSLPKHFDFNTLRKTPEELKAHFKLNGYDKIVAFQTRNPMHRAHVELTSRAQEQIGAHLLIHPAVGMTKQGDVDYFTRVKCYQKLLSYYPEDSVTLSLLPIAMRMAGPREAVWHAIIRKNYGCTHFIVGRDHAGPGKDSHGKDFYGPYEAQNLAQSLSKEIGIEIVPFNEMVYVKEDNNYQPSNEVAKNKTVLSISGTQLRKMLQDGLEIPSWFTYPQIVEELRKAYPPRSQQGFTLFMTGLSGAGKSTLANAIAVKLMEKQNRPITILDGDILRKHLSSELTFTREHRSLHCRRVGFVAGEITKNHGIAICALIAPYENDRQYNRNLINSQGNYIEIFVSTPLSICEQRDTKGLYNLAKQGKMQVLTGVNDPYESPTNPEIIVDTSEYTVEQAVDLVIAYLQSQGLID